MAKYYTLVPLPEGAFKDLSLIDRAVFGLIYERWRLSCYNTQGGSMAWYDETEQNFFCMFSHDELAKLTGTSEKTVRRSLQTLRKKDFITWRKAGFKSSCRYFVTRETAKYMSSLRKQHSKDGDESP